MISSLNFSYLSGKRGIHVTGVLLGLDNPWSLDRPAARARLKTKSRRRWMPQ